MYTKIRDILNSANEKKTYLHLAIGFSVIILALAPLSTYGAVPMDDPPGPPSFHYITGSATYGDTTPADGAQVTVLNERTGEELYDTVGPGGNGDKSGFYLVDLMELPAGIEEGDTINIFIQGVGTYSKWQGSESTVVDTDMVSQLVNITLSSNAPTKPTNIAPPNGATDINLNPVLQVGVSDPDGGLLSVSFYDASDNSLIDTVDNVASGSSAQTTWKGLSPGATYQWYAIVTDSFFETQSSTWSFSTQSMANRPPSKPTLVAPSDGSTGVSRSPTLRVSVSDPDGDYLMVSFYDASTDTLLGSVENVASGSTADFTWSGRTYTTTYSWYVTADDSVLETQSDTWQFTTQSPTGPSETTPSVPRNLQGTFTEAATGSHIMLTWSAPSDDGGTALTGYNIYRGTQSGQGTPFATVGTLLTYTDNDILVNATYYYRVSAINSKGEGAKTAEIAVTTSDSLPPSITNADISPDKIEPGKIVTISATVTDFSGVATVSMIITVDGEEVDSLELTQGIGDTWSADWSTDQEETFTVAITAIDLGGNQKDLEIGSFTVEKEDGIPGFEVTTLVMSLIILLGALTLIHHKKKK